MVLPKSILMAVGSIGFVLLGLAILVRLLENSITFHPTSRLEITPDDYGLDYREIRVELAEENLRLHGWQFDPVSEKHPVLLICHGNAGNISHRLEWLVPMLKRGWGAVLFDYRGYGLSGGKPSEQGLYNDSEAMYDYLTGEMEIAPERIVLFGRSLGGAPAAWLAGRKPVGRLVLEGTFTNTAAMARRLFGFLPLHYAGRYSWPVAKHLGLVSSPVLIIHGTNDSVVPFELGKQLAETADKGQDVTFRSVEGGDHLNLHHVIGQGYYDEIERFVGNN
jgi:uncharacterized protein